MIDGESNLNKPGESIKIIMEGELRSGRKFMFTLPDGQKVEAKIIGQLVDGKYLIAYILDGQDLGRKLNQEELLKILKSD